LWCPLGRRASEDSRPRCRIPGALARNIMNTRTYNYCGEPPRILYSNYYNKTPAQSHVFSPTMDWTQALIDTFRSIM